METTKGETSRLHEENLLKIASLSAPAHTKMPPLSKSRCVTCGSLILKRRSHIGRAVIQVPAEVSLDLAPLPKTSNAYVANPFLRDASVLSVKGPKGALQVTLPKFVSLQPPVQQKPASFAVSVRDPKAKPQRAMWGLTRSLIHNAIQGVHAGHQATINMVGVGYRAALESKEGASQLSMKLGYPNPVIEVVPVGIQAEVTSPTSILLRGADKQAIGQFAATIRRHRPPEPYNGKVRSSLFGSRRCPHACNRASLLTARRSGARTSRRSERP